MAKQIFVDPSPNIDETWTRGAMLGGMASYGEQALAESYFLAGHNLVAVVLDGGEAACDLINPILYLYRHGIELYLKLIVQPTKRSHDLVSLLDAFRRHVHEAYGEAVPTWITNPVTELARYDRASVTFRYGVSSDRRLETEGEFWIDLPSLGRIMAEIRRAFVRVLFADETGEVPPANIC